MKYSNMREEICFKNILKRKKNHQNDKVFNRLEWNTPPIKMEIMFLCSPEMWHKDIEKSGKYG